jgi:8-oxo-dGTP pyrophosphatase MutT (NUDIX family)
MQGISTVVNMAGRPGNNVFRPDVATFQTIEPAQQRDHFLPQYIGLFQNFGYSEAEATALAMEWLPDVFPYNYMKAEGYRNGRKLADEVIDSVLRLMTKGTITTDLLMPHTKDKLTFRPSVYAIILDNGKVLLLNTRHTGTYSLPGGGIDIGETLEVALKREVREETGLEIEVVRFHRFEEQFFYYDPLDVAFHSFLFFYVCRPKTFEVCADSEVDDGEVEKP